MEKKDGSQGLRGHSKEGVSELTRLFLCHFSDDLERAIRASYEQVFGRPLPEKFIITLGSPDDPPQER